MSGYFAIGRLLVLLKLICQTEIKPRIFQNICCKCGHALLSQNRTGQRQHADLRDHKTPSKT